MTLLIVLLVLLACLISFYGGIIAGVNDAKKTFNIPKGATGVNENGYIFD